MPRVTRDTRVAFPARIMGVPSRIGFVTAVLPVFNSVLAKFRFLGLGTSLWVYFTNGTCAVPYVRLYST